MFLKNNLLWLFGILLFANQIAMSQENGTQTSRNVVSLEIGGIGGYGSLNYERIILVQQQLNISFRVGISTYNIKDFTNQFNPDIIIPMSVYGFYGKNHKLVFGVGRTKTYVVEADYMNDWKAQRVIKRHTNVTLGYRWQKNEGGVIFGLYYSPTKEMYRTYRRWAGLVVGYAF